jgi:DNA-directed RNA polymerase specialized sigma24 family protein
VLVLRQFEGLSYAESAEVMGISVEAVTSLIHRARQAFRATYSRQQQEEER